MEEGSSKAPADCNRRSSADRMVDPPVPSSGNFYNEGVWELVKARRVLCGSYAYGYFLDIEASGIVPPGGFSPGGILCPSKTIFEFMQNELEEVTERLSEMMSRPYLRTPKKVIVQTTHACRQKRQEFLMGTYRGLVPPDLVNSCSKHSQQLLQLPAPSNRLIGRRHSDRAVEQATSQDDPWKRNKSCARQGCSNPCAAAQSATISRKFDINQFCSAKCSNSVNRHQPSQHHHHHRRESQKHHQEHKDAKDKSFTLPRSSKSDDNILQTTNEPQLTEMVSELNLEENSAAGVQSSNNTVMTVSNDVKEVKDNKVLRKEPTASLEQNKHKSSNTSEEDQTKSTQLSRESLTSTGSARPSAQILSTGINLPNSTTTNNSSSEQLKQLQQRGARPKLVRQKSFEIDSSDDGDLLPPPKEERKQSMPTLMLSTSGEDTTKHQRRPSSVKRARTPEQEPELKVVKGADQLLPKPGSKEGSQKKKGRKKKPCLTIKIQNSSVDIVDGDEDVSELGPSIQKELALSPNFTISGVSIRRQSPGALSAVSSPGRAGQQNSLTAAGSSRNRSSSLVVQTLTASSTHTSPSSVLSRSPRSPGSKSLHQSSGMMLTPPNSAANCTGCKSPKNQLLFTFPDIVASSSGSPAAVANNGSLSSVLHVHDSCLSSDDFHEAMFIGKPSPSRRSGSSGKRRKKSRASTKRESAGNGNIATATTNIPNNYGVPLPVVVDCDNGIPAPDKLTLRVTSQ